MKKILLIVAILLVLHNVSIGAFAVVDSIDGHYWELMTSDKQKSEFIFGYKLGRAHEMFLFDLFAGIMRKNHVDVADSIVDFCNSHINELNEIDVEEYVDFINKCYKAR